MGVARRTAAVVALGLILLVSAPASAGAGVHSKRLKACSVLTNADLEPIFERPFRVGLADDAGACNFRKPVLLKKDDIVVSVIPERLGSVKAAKRSFGEKLATTTELSGAAPESVRVGSEAFYTVFIGTDLLTMRLGRDVVEIRIENNDDDQLVYRDQAIAVAQAIAVHLATSS